MKVAVFGASGFVGQNLSELLAKDGIDFVACDITPLEGVETFISVDVTKGEEVETTLKNISHAIFLVAHPLPESLVDPKRNLEVNLRGLLNVLDAFRKKGSGKVLLASASSVYGKPPSGAISESSPCFPQTPYALTKYASEHYLRIFKDLYGIDYIAFRLFNVYGPGQSPSSRALIPRVLDLVMNEKEVEIFGDGAQSRDFIFVNDVARYFAIALSSAISGEIVNLGTGQLTSIAQIVALCGEVVGKTPRTRMLPARPGEISNFCAETTKLRTLFGGQAPTGIREGLRKTYEWLLSARGTKT